MKPVTDLKLKCGVCGPRDWERSIFSKAAEAAAQSLHIKVVAAGIGSTAEIEQAIEASAGRPSGGLIVLPDSITLNSRDVFVLGLTVPLSMLAQADQLIE